MILTNKGDSVALLLEAEQQGLMKGDYVFFLLQHFEVSGSLVSKHSNFITFATCGCTLGPKRRFGRWGKRPTDTMTDDFSSM